MSHRLWYALHSERALQKLLDDSLRIHPRFHHRAGRDDKTSLASQRAKIVAIAAAAGLTVDVFVEDPGVSGAKPMAERPAGGPMFASLTKGDTLIVAKLDRAFRNAAMRW